MMLEELPDIPDNWDDPDAPLPEPPGDYHTDEAPDRGPVDQLGEGAPPADLNVKASVLAIRIERSFVTADELDALPDPEPLIDGIIMRDSIAVLYGKPGNAKSFVALDWALCVATGTWWHGHEVHKGPVIYIVAEGAKGMKKRKRAWQEEQNTYNLSGIQWLPLAVNLLDNDWADALIATIANRKPELVVIDTLSRTMPGGNENAPDVMSRWVDNADRIRQAAGACVLVVAHSPKDGGSIRGHSALEGAAETTIEATKSGQKVTLTNSKAKDDPEFQPLILTLKTVPKADSCVLIDSHRGVGVLDDDPASERTLLRAAWESCGSDGLPSTALMRVSELSESTFYRARKALVDKGKLLDVGTPKRPRYIAVGPPDD